MQPSLVIHVEANRPRVILEPNRATLSDEPAADGAANDLAVAVLRSKPGVESIILTTLEPVVTSSFDVRETSGPESPDCVCIVSASNQKSQKNQNSFHET